MTFPITGLIITFFFEFGNFFLEFMRLSFFLSRPESVMLKIIKYLACIWLFQALAAGGFAGAGAPFPRGKGGRANIKVPSEGLSSKLNYLFFGSINDIEGFLVSYFKIDFKFFALARPDGRDLR
jgi:hypothetical protein